MELSGIGIDKMELIPCLEQVFFYIFGVVYFLQHPLSKDKFPAYLGAYAYLFRKIYPNHFADENHNWENQMIRPKPNPDGRAICQN